MASIVYLLCAVTCLLCAVLLLRQQLRSPAKLLFWSGIAFILFFLANALLFVDLVILPGRDLSLYRNLSWLLGSAMLLYGLIWETN